MQPALPFRCRPAGHDQQEAAAPLAIFMSASLHSIVIARQDCHGSQLQTAWRPGSRNPSSLRPAIPWPKTIVHSPQEDRQSQSIRARRPRTRSMQSSLSARAHATDELVCAPPNPIAMPSLAARNRPRRSGEWRWNRWMLLLQSAQNEIGFETGSASKLARWRLAVPLPPTTTPIGSRVGPV